MQLPIAFIFGFLTDFAVSMLAVVQPTSYLQQWLFCGIGILLVAVGVSFEVTANVIVLAGEGFILAVCKICPIKFGTMKVCFDVSLVLISCILSVIFLHVVGLVVHLFIITVPCSRLLAPVMYGIPSATSLYRSGVKSCPEYKFMTSE